MELLAIPNVRTDLANIRRNAEQLRQMLERRRMAPQITDPPPGALGWGERPVPAAARTIVFCTPFAGPPGDSVGWALAKPCTQITRAGTLEEGADEIRLCSAHSAFPHNGLIYARSSG